MSTHFDLFFAFDLKSEKFDQIAAPLNYLLGKVDVIENPPLDSFFADDKKASFFVTEEWKGLLVLSHNQMSDFPGEGIVSLFSGYRYNLPQYEMDLRHTLTFRDEILLDDLHLYYFFLDWIAPYSETSGFIGYIRSQYDFYPSLLLFKHGRLAFQDTDPKPPQKADS
ncbi:MAG: hypothetical protein K8I30_08220 [Anaerolineae bacterium]|nr:hypothetical protein [Anaerolineae bacterium]